jgi:hypothetical protein
MRSVNAELLKRLRILGRRKRSNVGYDEIFRLNGEGGYLNSRPRQHQACYRSCGTNDAWAIWSLVGIHFGFRLALDESVGSMPSVRLRARLPLINRLIVKGRSHVLTSSPSVCAMEWRHFAKSPVTKH